VISCKLVRGWS